MKVLPASEMEDVAFASRDDDFLSALGELRPFADAVFAENPEAQRNCAMKLMRMPEALAEEINTIAAEILGDIVMEEADGRWEIIDCYRELWTNGG